MKTLKFVAMAALAMSIAQPSYAADVEADAGAKIIAPLQISNATALYFGTIAPSLTTADQVVVTPVGAKSCGAELTCLTDDHTAALFNVSGEADASYTVDLPNSINISNGAGSSMVSITSQDQSPTEHWFPALIASLSVALWKSLLTSQLVSTQVLSQLPWSTNNSAFPSVGKGSHIPFPAPQTYYQVPLTGEPHVTQTS